MNTSADIVRVAYPLFQEGGGGANPTSALQLNIAKIDKNMGWKLNKCWHSRLPNMGNWQICDWYGAEYDGIIFAVASWGNPIARKLNGKGWWELRRMAIANDAPKNTASRMLKIMRILIKQEKPEINKLISYQDTAVHNGTIYKAAGWKPETCLRSGCNWNNPARFKNGNVKDGPIGLKQATAKIRWEYDI